ncbi:hypothetical protein ACN28S_50175 [Cystobacter fuscus]
MKPSCGGWRSEWTARTDSRRRHHDVLPPSLDWRSWLRRWDAQQTGYLPRREQRFEVMLDVLSELLPEEFVLVDLACGPGSISQRVLERFPKARCIAVDLDPVLLTLGRSARRWRGTAALGGGGPDDGGPGGAVGGCVGGCGAEHHGAALAAGRAARGALPPTGTTGASGGRVPQRRQHSVLATAQPLQRLAEQARRRDEAKAFGERGVEDWEVWWKALAAEPGMGPLIEERQRLFAGIRRDWSEPLLEVHEAALRDAGFQDVGVLWQHLDDRIILAVR